MSTRADIAIIGGGVAGLSLAAAIGGRASVVVLEAEAELFHHTSSRSAQQMQPTYGPAPVRRLTSASIPMVEAVAQRLGRPIFTSRPLLWLHESEERAHFDDLLATYRQDALAAGAQILPRSPLESAERVGDSWRLVAGGRTVEAAIVVDAAGAWADRVAALFGAEQRHLVPKRRTVAVARSAVRTIDPSWPMAADVADRFYFRPRGDTMLACALEDEPSEPEDARPRQEVVATALERVNGATDLQLRDPIDSWTGLRTIAADGLPVVGRDGAVPGFYWLAGQAGFGIQTSAALGTVVAADLLGEDHGLGGLDGVLEAIGPDRAALRA